MCGITGIFAFNLLGRVNMINVVAATEVLEQRGPDFQNVYTDEYVGLGHRRLSVIDPSSAGNQPMWDTSGRYCIVFNGEIFNFKALQAELDAKGIKARSQSDTETLLNLFILEGAHCLNKLNGFFAFCVYDRKEQSFFLARDRYGVKPLLYLMDEDKFLFASEMKSILCYGIEKDIDYVSLYTYLQLNYIPAPNTIFTHVKKLLPGHWMKISPWKMTTQRFYSLPLPTRDDMPLSYEKAKKKFKNLMEASVRRRLVADVPLGAFLSGGIDSSIVVGLAKKHQPDLRTFSMGFKSDPFFDETAYAQLVARHFNTSHTVFSLNNNDWHSHLYSLLNYIDEPFADSSAIAVYMLSREMRKYATVALSGDGADEILAGYAKHRAWYRILHSGWTEHIIGSLGSVWKRLPHGRNNALLNSFRRLHRFAESIKLPAKERYWKLAGFAGEEAALKLLSPASRNALSLSLFQGRKEAILSSIGEGNGMNDMLHTDVQLVLQNDMLTKIDLMSMANSLEVRNPFLDYELVDFVFSLPDRYKINSSMQKRVAQDAFREMLPSKLYNRPKKGFEVPLLRVLRGEMKSLITDGLLAEKHIEEQAIFNYSEIAKLKQQLFSSNPGDVHARIWGLIVFQYCWKRYAL